MTPGDLVQTLLVHRILIRRDGNELVLHAPFGDCLPDDLLQRVRSHRAELLAYLDWEAEADRLVLDSTERLADAWPAGCPLDGPEWQREEDSLATAYGSMDLDRLVRALADRELCAGIHFHAYRKEVTK